VQSLLSIGRKDLASLITQDYLQAYADGFNQYIRDLSRITTASQETMTKPQTKGPLNP
jgi:acyl-homoserine lactone acylase PvdQ